MTAELTDLDPFELPDWLGDEQVVWSADTGVRAGYLVAGRLQRANGEELPCDLLAVDEAYPTAVADADTRGRAHLSWELGEVLLVEREGRPALAVPGYYFSADRVLDALERLARAVGSDPERYAARLRVGTDRTT